MCENKMRAKAIGYDIRQLSTDYVNSLWNTKRRKELLLNDKIEWPLTIDKNLWYSVFTYLGENNPKAEKDPMTIAIKEDDVEWNHNMLGYWPNYEDMFRFFISHKKNIKTGIPIYVEAYLFDDIPKQVMLEVILEKTFTTKEKPEDWILLGFDVADYSFLSGLTNCGYKENIRKDLISSGWLDKLNEFGLLNTLNDALAFKQITDKRVHSLAPFYIYKLFKAPQIITAE
jgi:hypothetical protein